MEQIKICDLILLKENQFSPADILVLDSGTIKLDKKIFKANQDRMMGDQNLIRYAMSKFISMENNEGFKNSS